MTPEPGHHRLVLAVPPKPVSDVTEEELRQWSDEIYAALVTQQDEPT
jgi:hypothetical protein